MNKCFISIQGRIYNGCTIADASDNQLWCSVRVDSRGNHIGGQGLWGHCAPNCPNDQSNNFGFLMAFLSVNLCFGFQEAHPLELRQQQQPLLLLQPQLLLLQQQRDLRHQTEVH